MLRNRVCAAGRPFLVLVRLLLERLESDDHRPRTCVDGEPEDVRTMVMTHRVEPVALRAGVREVDLGGQDRLLVPCGTRDNPAVRTDDHAVALLWPVRLVPFGGPPDTISVREVPRNLVNVEARVNADDIAAALLCDVAERCDPPVAAFERRGEPDV